MIERKSNIWIKRGLHGLAIAGLVAASIAGRDKSADAAVGSLETESVLLILDRSRIPDQLYYERFNLEAIGPTNSITPQELVRLGGPKDSTVLAKLILWTEISKKGPVKVCVETYQKPQTCEEILGIEKSISWYPIYTESLKKPGDYIVADSARLKAEGTGEVEIEVRITDDQGIGLLTSAKTKLSILDRQVYLPSIRKGVSLAPQTYFPYLQTFTLWEKRQEKRAA